MVEYITSEQIKTAIANLPQLVFEVCWTKYEYILLFFILIPSFVSAQRKQGDATLPHFIDTDKMSVIDRGYMKVFYAFNAENVNDSQTYIDKQCLEIGRNVSKYYSIFAFHRDSLINDWIKKHPKARSVPQFFSESKRNYYWSEYQYSEWFGYKNTATVYSRMPSGLKKYDCKYTETLPLQKWVLHSEMQKLCGFMCYKATCTFRGRHYTAWYTQELPAGYGPWKFGGLPGLILKVCDSQGLYTFECIRIEHFQFPVKQHDYSSYILRSRNDVLELEKSINENYYKIAKMRSMKTGEYLSKYTPYHPMELY